MKCMISDQMAFRMRPADDFFVSGKTLPLQKKRCRNFIFF